MKYVTYALNELIKGNQMESYETKWSQMTSNAVKWHQMKSNDMLSNDNKSHHNDILAFEENYQPKSNWVKWNHMTSNYVYIWVKISNEVTWHKMIKCQMLSFIIFSLFILC